MGLRAAALAIAVLVALGFAPATRAVAQSTQIGDKIEGFLAQGGYHYKRHNAVTWSMPATASGLEDSKIIMSTGSDILVTFVIVAKNKTLKKSPQLMSLLLRTNHDYDYVKVGFDRDGDLFVRIDTPLRLIDAAKLGEDIKQVNNAAGEILGKMNKLPH